LTSLNSGLPMRVDEQILQAQPVPTTCALLAVRHAQASLGADNYDQLSARGVHQAERLGAWWARRALRLDALWCGPLQRQVDTARHLVRAAASLGWRLPAPVVLEEFRELAVGPLMQQVSPQLQKLTPASDAQAHVVLAHVLDAWAGASVDIGPLESFDQFEGRVRQGLARAAASGGQVAVVTSVGPIAMTTRQALGLERGRTMKLGFGIGNSSVSEFGCMSGDLSLRSFNDLGHLDRHEITYL
jgi:broad specificity phosphatase PhoE